MFASNVNAAAASASKYITALNRAGDQKWNRDSKIYVQILGDIQAMRNDGCAAGTIKKDLFAEFARAIEENPSLESEIKAFRAPLGRLFKDKAFEDGGRDWAEYVGGFSTQAEWRDAHRKKSEKTEPEGATDAQKIEAAWSILASCDDIEAAIAEINSRALAQTEEA